MREEATSERERGAVVVTAERLEAGRAEIETSLDQLDVRPLAQRVRDDGLVLLDCDGAGRVDDVATGGARVDRGEDQLLLQVREQREVACGLRSQSRRPIASAPC